MLVVIDTNILVSAFWSSDGNPARILSLVQNGAIVPCYDHRIVTEYKDVLLRPRFGFSPQEVSDVVSQIVADGVSVVAKPLAVHFVDLSDKAFYEVAKQCGAILITGNLRHFPTETSILSPKDFLEKYPLS
jgi:putative PIN family toxin of toxin-antitoxin system